MPIGLVYLARGVDGGLPSSKAFFDAYRTFSAGCPHELIVITKGWSDVAEYKELLQLARAHTARIIELPDDGFDWGAYMRLTPQLTNDWLCFLNTHSRPRVQGWLNFLHEAATSQGVNVGAVGATASWETLAPILPPLSVKAENNQAFLYPFRLIRNTVRLVKNRRDFPSFPNPHLRSNAFIVRRQVFVDFVLTKSIPRCKRDAAVLESGRTGFSAYLASHDMKFLVAGANGNVYGPEQWINSQTFRVPGQANLLVADNQTKAYDMANRYMKSVLERFAWGRAFS